MKSIKLIFILFFIISIKVFSQNPVIQDVNFCAGSSISSVIVVENPSLTAAYTWQVKTPTIDWTSITSTNAGVIYKDYNTAILNITRSNSLPVTLTKYRVIANDGSGDLISDEAVLTVNPLPVAKTITGASAVCIGGDKTLTYGTDSVGDIQWQYSTTSGTEDFNDIDLENELIYKATDIQDTTWYRVMNTSGSCNPTYSKAVQVIVNSLPVAGDIEGGDVSVCKTSNFTEMSLYNAEGKISWQKSSNIEGPYTDINSATSTIYNASSLMSTTYFRVALTNGVCPTEYTEPKYINVDPTPTVKSITGISRICSGSNTVLTYESGSVGDIEWQTSNSPISDDFNEGTGETSLTLNINNLVETTWFRVMNTSGECNPVYSPVFKVTVDELPYEGFIATADDVITVCRTNNSTVLNLYNSEGSIQWQRATDISGVPSTFSNIPSATKDIFTALSLTETTHFRVVLSSGVCLTAITDPVKILVNQPAVVKSITGATPVCSDGSKVLVYKSGSFGEIQWQLSTTSGSADFEDIGGENLEIYTVSNLLETSWFRVSNTNGVCKAYSQAVTVLVNPLPVSGTITVVVGNNTVLENLNNTELSLINYKGSIQWQKSKSLSDDFIDIPNATSSSFQTSGLKDSTYFRTVVSSGNCSKAVSEPINIEANLDFDVTLFPNPFDNEFNIHLTSLSLDPIEFEVYDLLGRTIDNQKIKPTEINSKKIGTNYLPGFYTLFIKQGNQNQSIKMIKK